MGKRLHGEAACERTAYALKMIEQSVIVSLLDASAHPESLLAAMQVYQAQQNAAGETSNLPDLRKERAALEAALRQLGQNEAITIQAQIAGIATGASPNAYAAVFADIAAQRKDLEDRRGALARLLTMLEKNGSKNVQKPASCLAQQPLEDLARVLSSDIMPGQEKRDLVGTVIDRVVCQPKGADVFFLPGLGAARFYASSEGAETCNSTLTELMQ